MRKNIILIDYENVQDVNLKPLLDHDVMIMVFHNKDQKFPAPILNLAQEFGKDRFCLVEISGSGKNAADFHIAYFLGKLSKEIENPFFHIISKDTGFKPLVHYVKNEDKIYCLQEPVIAEIPLLKPPVQVTDKDHYQMVAEALQARKVNKPKRIKTLRNEIVNICKKEIGESEVDFIIQQLKTKGVIILDKEVVSYP